MAELEAMACARPVVTWFDQDAVYPEEPPFVRALEGADVAAAIIRLADDAALRDELGRDGRAWVSRYHQLSQAAARVETVAYAILDGRSIPEPAWPPAA
jgi:glycosyltransferase involved in cell wall biosynthesis